MAMVLLLMVGAVCARAQPESVRVMDLEGRVATLESQVSSHATECAAVVVCGAFCALWAQNSGRNPWLWFFSGLVFSVVAVLVLLYKNANDRRVPAG
jgi:hypothetical protein